uniref:uncharacterized protein n=1 Tax=Myxine glutinosa TaxID=7769 RepID=UPI00358F3F6D
LNTLYNKKNYVLHQRNLRQYLSKGLRVEKIHRVIKFNQGHWLKGYIDFNTQRRTESKTDFEKDFYKLMNNAVFGKTMENVRKRQNIRLSTSWKQASKLINRPSFTRAEVFTENFCAIHLIKESIEMDKPIYIGTSILDLSKSLMYDYFYNNLRNKYQNDVNLLYMDTDSFILQINTDDVYSVASDKPDMTCLAETFLLHDVSDSLRALLSDDESGISLRPTGTVFKQPSIIWTAAVKTANERKAQLKAQKEVERHNRELDKEISGSGVIVDFAEKLESLPDKGRLGEDLNEKVGIKKKKEKIMWVDEVCMKHDIAYGNTTTLDEKHEADRNVV